MSELILFEKIGKVGKITLNRPDKYNSMVEGIALPLLSHLNTCAKDNDIRAIYLTGSGKAFCAGQDLKEVVEAQSEGKELDHFVTNHYNPIIRAIRGMEKPVVAAVNGVAAGAGANIALACDIVVAKESASFIQAFSKIGLIPDSGGTFTLQRLVGYQRAMAITMLGDKIGAAEAERMGMIYKYFADEEFEAKSWELAERLSSMPTQGLALTKLAYQQGLTNTMDQQLEVENKFQVKASNTADFKEGVAAFLEKRKPTFTGR